MKLLKKIYMVVMFIALCACAHTASATPIISVEPAFIEVSEGENFTVNIMVSPAGSEILGAQYKLYFDNTLLSVFDQVKGTFLSHDGASTIPIVDKLNNTAGCVEYGEMRTGVDYGVNTSGILATITFNATRAGACALTLNNVKLSDPSETNKILDIVINDGTCEIVASIHTPTPTSTAAPIATSKPSSPTPVTTATAVQTDTDKTPPLPGQHITETESAMPAQTQAHPSEDNTPQTGFTSAIAITGMFIVLYVILRKK